MTLDQKLQIKPDQPMAVLHPPGGFELAARAADAAASDAGVLVFVRNREELEEWAGPALDAARQDRLAWIAYPKGGRLGTDLNRDGLVAIARERGVRGVRQVSIDDVWSALRFRPA